MDWKGKIVVITGSAQGIGKKVAEILGKKGASVVINSRNDKKVDETTEELTDKGISCIGITGDISSVTFCHKLKERCLAAFGKIDFLICNAGIAAQGLVKDSLPEVYRKVITVNMLGSVNPSLILLDEIKKNNGGILFVSSHSAIIGLPQFSAYSMSKRGIVNFAESLKTELLDDGVYVGVNYPGFTKNEESKTIINVEGEAQLLGNRSNVNASSMEKTASCIVRQIEKRKFRSYCTLQGRMMKTIYNLSPNLSMWIVKILRKKIMKL